MGNQIGEERDGIGTLSYDFIHAFGKDREQEKEAPQLIRVRKQRKSSSKHRIKVSEILKSTVRKVCHE